MFSRLSQMVVAALAVLVVTAPLVLAQTPGPGSGGSGTSGTGMSGQPGTPPSAPPPSNAGHGDT
jgi:hypothetical protein